MKELQSETSIFESTISDSAEKIVNKWLSYSPKIIGIGIYIWNIDLLSTSIALLKQKQPEIIIVIGGPEVSYGTSDDLNQNIDYLIPFEGDLAFYNLCKNILNDRPPKSKYVPNNLVNVHEIQLPYDFYTDEDIAHRKVYVESSRGCVFTCQFCLSSLDKGIRSFEINKFLGEVKKLYLRGARQFKFVDRSFNVNTKHTKTLLLFFLEEFPLQDYFLHFEVIPDRFPQELKELILRFRKGVLQFEVGVQTLDEKVITLIGRKQNRRKTLENLQYLRKTTNIHLHVDLIIGLPGANMEIFKDDLNELTALKLQEIQIGILKKLKGTPISQHSKTYKMQYSLRAPYEIESNIHIDKTTMSQFKIFAKYWDKYYNSGNFIDSIQVLFGVSNPFDAFFDFTKYAYAHLQATFGISLERYSEILYYYLVDEKQKNAIETREKILRDILKKPGRKVPKFLRDYKLGIPKISGNSTNKSLVRQCNYQSE